MEAKEFEAMYEKYQAEAADIMAREKTALMSMPNMGSQLDPKKLAHIDEAEAVAFWEMSKCLIP